MWFSLLEPPLLDQTPEVIEPQSFEGPAEEALTLHVLRGLFFSLEVFISA